jgi:hypothetical protein
MNSRIVLTEVFKRECQVFIEHGKKWANHKKSSTFQGNQKDFSLFRKSLNQ